jgi:hypothetical protein
MAWDPAVCASHGHVQRLPSWLSAEHLRLYLGRLAMMNMKEAAPHPCGTHILLDVFFILVERSI